MAATIDDSAARIWTNPVRPKGCRPVPDLIEHSESKAIIFLIEVKPGLFGNCLIDRFIDPLYRQFVRDGVHNSPVLL